jgi:fructose-bisphosphate aldolase class 1
VAFIQENRRAYRELFYTADVGRYYSGAIMYKETLFQSATDGRSFVDCLAQQGVFPGVKVDEVRPPTVTHTLACASRCAAARVVLQVAAGGAFRQLRR